MLLRACSVLRQTGITLVREKKKEAVPAGGRESVSGEIQVRVDTAPFCVYIIIMVIFVYSKARIIPAITLPFVPQKG